MKFFISYAREDRLFAERLYAALINEGFDVWLDTKSLQPGQNWKYEIRKAIRSVDRILLVLSEHSVSKRGYCQKEIKDALEVLQETPTGDISIIPIRLDNCEPRDAEITDLNYFDLFPDYSKRISGLVQQLEQEVKDSTAVARTLPSTTPLDHIVPVRIFSPFESFGEFVRLMFSHFPENFTLADQRFAFYFVVETNHPGTRLPNEMREQNPERIILVLQHQFDGFKVGSTGIRVRLMFGGVPSEVAFDYDAIREIACPQLGMALRHDPRQFLTFTQGPQLELDARKYQAANASEAPEGAARDKQPTDGERPKRRGWTRFWGS